jgi:hypothetical protein
MAPTYIIKTKIAKKSEPNTKKNKELKMKTKTRNKTDCTGLREKTTAKQLITKKKKLIF